MSNPLQQLGEHGQSVWLDFISRELVTTGQLEQRIADENVTGLTSNPTIFQKAIAEGSLYDDQIRELISSGIDDPQDVFTELAISDIQHAADILRPVHERTSGADGYVSLEVPPALSHDTDATIATARSLWERVDRPNLMIKIPATLEGMPAIHRTLADGRNVNITLIFALAMHDRVINQYITALEDRSRNGESLDVHSVASFFVSRVDTLVDKLLEQKLAADPGNAQIEGLFGKAAIANAVLAYELFEQRFGSDRFAPLRTAGAHVQRPLWASTSAKNPNYRDVVYAEALIGPDTVDTMPPATIEAFKDHGVVAGDTVKSDYAGAHRVMDQLAEVGIDMDAVTQQLLDDGVKQFADSYDELIRGIAEKIDSFGSGYTKRQHFDTGSTDVPLNTPAASEVATRIWHRDPNLWKPGDAAHAKVINNRLGWLDVVGAMHERLPALQALAVEVREAGWRDCVLLGMGGSSLCPEVLRLSFGSAEGQPTLACARHHRSARDHACDRCARPREDRLHRLEQVGDDHRDAVPPGALLGADPGGRRRHRLTLHRDHRPRNVAGRPRSRARVPSSLQEPTGHRRPLLGLEHVRPRPRRDHRHRRRAAPRACREHAQDVHGRRARRPQLRPQPRHRHGRPCTTWDATRSRSSRRKRSVPTRCGPSSSSRRAPARKARGSSRSATSRSARPTSTPTTACLSRCASATTLRSISRSRP